jgi:hypothetical protein
VRTRVGARAIAIAIAALIAAAALALGGCTPGDSTAPSIAIQSVGPGGIGPPVTLPPGATPLVHIDASLLAVLPTEVDGLSVLESTEAEADAQANGSLASLSDGVVGALAIDPGTGDFVLVDVVRLRTGAMDDTTFRSWRDTFDAGVCVDSGVTGNAESTIGGRTVEVGTCGNGFHTYHAWIQDKGLLVSASTGGTRQLGQLLFENLKP